ncbi:MAG: DNA-processing protein DprA, partial [Myxococcota bacterium]|nr:DNA-processing protein DprA [Myxococcota bacterium]
PIGENCSLAAEKLQSRLVGEGGVVLSEVAPGTAVRPGFFPRRNRIIAALGLACVVVEANRRSGALITARLANDLGREVAAVPGQIGQPFAAGCLRLIADGARCLQSVGEVTDLIGSSLPQDSASIEPSQALERALAQPSTLEELVAACGLSVIETTRLLGIWEITGRVRREAGGRWRLSASCAGPSS